MPDLAWLLKEVITMPRGSCLTACGLVFLAMLLLVLSGCIRNSRG